MRQWFRLGSKISVEKILKMKCVFINFQLLQRKFRTSFLMDYDFYDRSTVRKDKDHARRESIL